jgi:hypothetical protein
LEYPVSGYTYFAFGLTVRSEIEFSHLTSAVGAPDVHVRLGKVPGELPDTFSEGVLYRCSPDGFLFDIDKVARYLVSNGNDVCIQPVPGADADAIRLFLFGSAFGALLHQRGVLPLHGSAVLTPRGAIVFTGTSGSGKSTLACAFHQKGYRVLSDDVCAIRSGDAPAVLPGIPCLMLWADTLRELGIDPTGFDPVRPRIEKFIFPLKHGFAGDAAVLHAIYVLEPVNSNVPAMVSVKGFRKFEMLAQNLYRPRFVEHLNVEAVQLKQIAEVAQRTLVKVVHRPDASFQARSIADLIERDFSA